MANEQVSERDQFLAHFNKLDDAAGDRSSFEMTDEQLASAANSNPAPSPNQDEEAANTQPEGDQPEGEQPNKADEGKEKSADAPKGDEPKGDEPKGDEPKGDEPKGDDTKPGDSKYKKAQRGRERLEEIRKKAEAEKAEAKRLRDEAERRHNEVKQLIDQAVNQRRPQTSADPTGEGRFSAEEFRRAGDWHEAEAEKAIEAGDLEKYHEHAQNAKQLRRAANSVEVKQREEANRKAAEEFAKTYGEHAEAVIKANPDLGIESELSNKMKALLESEPILTMIPDGFKKAFEILQLREEAGKAAGLLEQLNKANAEVERLTKLTSLEPGEITPVGSESDIEKMPVEKQREHFRKQFERADGVR